MKCISLSVYSIFIELAIRRLFRRKKLRAEADKTKEGRLHTVVKKRCGLLCLHKCLLVED
jgi:flavin reductase (DIM6/NTAB) family NADH-FMN oxidoreductase RutF